MKFQFQVNVSENQYIDYNKFWTLKSPYGKKQLIILRGMILVMVLVFVFLTLFSENLQPNAFIACIPFFIMLIVCQALLPRFLAFTVESHIKSLKKKGKMAYSSTSVMEFYDDVFTETTPDNKLEQKYSSVERISVVNKKVIYIHVNNFMAYIIPVSVFQSQEQYEEFMQFIKTKCAHADIDIY